MATLSIGESLYAFFFSTGSNSPSWYALMSNPWAVTIGGGAIVLLLGWIGRKLFVGRRLPEGSTASPQQIASQVLTQNFNPTINVHSPERPAEALPAMTAGSKEARAAEPAPPVPRFEYRGPREKSVYVNAYATSGITDPRNEHEFKEAIEALCLRFENLPVGGAKARALDVIAKASFRSADGTREQPIDYCVWLNSPCNSTDMDVGDTRELVIVCAVDGKLVSFADRREGHHSYIDQWSWLEEHPVDGLELVEIRLIDRSTGAVSTVSLRVWYAGGHFNVALRNSS